MTAGPDPVSAALDGLEEAGPPEARQGEPTGEDRVCARLLRNDIGNGERLRVRFGANLTFVPGLGWLHWSGAHWNAESGEMEARKCAQLTARAIFAERLTVDPPAGPDPKERLAYEAALAAIGRFAKASGNTGKISAMLAEAAPHLMALPQSFDAADFALNLAERGTLHLALDGSFALRPPQRPDRITKRAGVRFDPGARAPRWLAFLEQMQPDPAVRAFLQRWAGLMLTGSTAENVFAIHFGSGRNGKGTFLSTLRRVLGDYAVFVNIATVGVGRQRQSGGEASPDVMRMRGARMVQLSDAPPDFELDEGFVKQVTGNEPVIARQLQKEPVEFVPRFKLNFTCNAKPKIRGTDDGIWRRVLLINWPVQIVDGAEDRGLAGALDGEAAGILNWALDGYRLWRTQGLSPPDAVRAAVETYRRESDPLGEFLSLWVDRVEWASVLSKTLFEKYKDYCADDGLPEPKSPVSFGKALRQRGHVSMRTTGGVKAWRGLALRQTARVEDEPSAPPEEGRSRVEGARASARHHSLSELGSVRDAEDFGLPDDD